MGVCLCVQGRQTQAPRTSSISVGVVAGLVQSLCKQVINGSEHCSYGWRAEAGGAGLEENKNLSSGETFTLWRRKQRQPQLGDVKSKWLPWKRLLSSVNVLVAESQLSSLATLYYSFHTLECSISQRKQRK